jgi:pimeloyl-ACP methyl ester carboxylesterase
MTKRAFIIPGFTELPTRKGISEITKMLEKAGYSVIKVSIDWNYHVMSDYVGQFTKQYLEKKGDQNLVLGFSFGAMIAVISALELQPNRLILCSLSPFFAEDMKTIPIGWKRTIGKHRTKDFSRLSLKKICKKIEAKTSILVGEKEVKQYPQMLKTAIRANNLLSNSKMLKIPNGKHNIGQLDYLQAINEVIEEY